MKKTWKARKLTLSRETLVNLDHLDVTQLDRVLGLGPPSAPVGCTASTCNRPCTCPV